MDKNMLKNLDHTLSNCIHNKYVNNGLIVLCVLYISFAIDNMSSDVLKIFDNSLLRLLLLVLVAYVAHHSPVVGILLAICYVLTVQHLNNAKVNGVPVEGYWTEDPSPPTEQVHANPDEMEPDEAASTDEPPVEDFNDYQACDSFTTNDELEDAQSNSLSGQDAQVQTWEQQLGPQGIGSEPTGQNMSDVGGPSPF